MEDVKRFSVMEVLQRRSMNNREAAMALNLSVRQIKRIKKKVKKDGLDGVIHGNTNRPSAHAFAFKNQAIEYGKDKVLR